MIVFTLNQRAFIGAFLLTALFLPLEAQAGLLSQVTELLRNNISDSDESMSMLRMVFGDFVFDPFGQQEGAASSNMLASMFKDYNMFIFVVAMIWFTYNGMAGLAQTMHEGVVLGRRMSTVWVPIRFAFGAASLMPVFGGWAFCQALMVIAATLGIAGANLVTKTALDSTSGFQVMVNPMATIKQAGQLRDIEDNLLRFAVCSVASEKLNAERNTITGSQLPVNFSPVPANGEDRLVLNFPGIEGKSACGKIEIIFNSRSDNTLRSAFGFRMEGVNYDAIRRVSMTAHDITLLQVFQRARTIVQGAEESEANSAQLQTALGTLNNGYFGSYNTQLQENLKKEALLGTLNSNSVVVSDALQRQMREGGWATLGIWNGVFAEVNEAMNEMLDPKVEFTEPNFAATSTYADLEAAVSGVVQLAKAGRRDAPPEKGTLETATGNTSLGQWLMRGVISGTVGASSTGQSDMINPIIAFKNLGDNALALAQTAYVAAKAAEFLPLGKIASLLSKGGDAASGASAAAKSDDNNKSFMGGIGSMFKSFASDAGGLMVMVAFALFAAGAIMAFYLPLLPFIQWFAALLQWFASIVESLIGSSLWALAHFDSDGEGMGQRTSYGYLYMLNNFARPIIMTFSFFIASAAVIVMGTFLFKYFGNAVASAQGNSLTGLVSIVAFVTIFMVMGITMVNSAYQIMLSAPDRIIGWIGQNASSSIGQEVEGRVNALFVNAAGAGGRIMGGAKGAMGGAKSAGGAGNSGGIVNAVNNIILEKD